MWGCLTVQPQLEVTAFGLTHDPPQKQAVLLGAAGRWGKVETPAERDSSHSTIPGSRDQQVAVLLGKQTLAVE